jgi:hypothetical protein
VKGRRSRIAVVVSVIVAATFSLSGCATLAGVVKKSEASLVKSSKPKVGDCWKASFRDDSGLGDWGGRPAVSCHATHQLYTFAVSHLEHTYKGKLFDKAGYVYTAIWNDARGTCKGTELNEFSALQPTATRDDVESYLPDERLWDLGARWVRCDIGILAVGSPVQRPVYEKLPSITVLTRQITTAPTQFDYCTNIPDGATVGPRGVGSVFANCLDHPLWTLEAYFPLTPGPGGADPTPSAAVAQYKEECQSKFADATHVTYAYYPSQSDWSDGYKDYECWIGLKS